jgi:hypothetical protein
VTLPDGGPDPALLTWATWLVVAALLLGVAVWALGLG